MKKAQVEVGKVYVMKVSGQLTRVRLDSKSPYGGWVGTNLKTNREVRIRTAAKLRREATSEPAANPIADHRLQQLIKEGSLTVTGRKQFQQLPARGDIVVGTQTNQPTGPCSIPAAGGTCETHGGQARGGIGGGVCDEYAGGQSHCVDN